MIKVYGTGTKKMLNILILYILRKYSDETHHLTQQEIIRKLRSEFGVEKIDRRSVRANVESLADMGYCIETDSRYGYYMYDREFEDAELRLLIDSVLYSKVINKKTAERLTKKIKDLGNIYFDLKVPHINCISDMNKTDNNSVLYNVNSVNEAIEKKKKILFRYNKYGLDFKMHDQGKDYKMNPYQMVMSNGYYYLLGNIDKYDNVSYFRIDKMSKVEVLEDEVKAPQFVKGLNTRLDLPKKMIEQIYMVSGETVEAEIKAKIYLMDSLVDWFGTGFRIIENDGEDMVISVKCNEKALFYWSLQYGQHIEVLRPQSLRNMIKEAISKMMEKYK